MNENSDSEQLDLHAPDEETTGDEALDRRLSEPILRGDKGLDTAQIWISGFLIIIAGMIAYSNVVAAPFHAFDHDALVGNTALHKPSTFADGLTHDHPRPAAMLSLCLNWWLTNGAATTFHVVNIAIHLANSVLVFLLCRRLLRGRSSEAMCMVAGLLFVLHPALTESVNLAMGRAELLATLFSLLSLLLFASATQDADRPRYKPLAVSWLCYFLAMASHECALVLPLFLILLHVRVGNDSAAYRYRLLYAPYLVLMALSLATHVSGSPMNALKDVFSAAAVSHFAERLLLSVYPAGLSVWREPGLIVPNAALTVSAYVGMGLVLAAVCRYRNSVIAWCLSLWILGLAFVELTAPAGAFVSERSLYLPAVGLVLLVPAVVVTVLTMSSARILGGLVAAALVISAGTAAFLRNNVWIDDLTLWKDAASKYPNAARPQLALGDYYLAQGRSQIERLQASATQTKKAPEEAQIQTATEPFRLAEPFLTRARELAPQDAKTLASLGAVQSALGKPKDASESLLAALRLDSNDQAVTVALANALDEVWRGSGKRDDLLHAVDYFKRAESLGPLPGDARARYGLELYVAGDFAGAETALRAAVGDATDSPLNGPLKDAQERQKSVAAATGKVLSLLSKDSSNPEGLRLLGQVYILTGHYLNALYTSKPDAQRRAAGLGGMDSDGASYKPG